MTRNSNIREDRDVSVMKKAFRFLMVIVLIFVAWQTISYYMMPSTDRNASADATIETPTEAPAEPTIEAPAEPTIETPAEPTIETPAEPTIETPAVSPEATTEAPTEEIRQPNIDAPQLQINPSERAREDARIAWEACSADLVPTNIRRHDGTVIMVPRDVVQCNLYAELAGNNDGECDRMPAAAIQNGQSCIIDEIERPAGSAGIYRKNTAIFLARILSNL